MTHGVGSDAGTRNGGLDHGGGQLGVGNVLEAAAKSADGRARGADNEDVSGAHGLSPASRRQCLCLNDLKG
ncbi:hypothetical protein SDC9_197893 [bioreactor metagenome]|uniref:Uncharacterized protein n=1 Tax=bioreactor metagenome TaxID=1076179 RepID=A0A645IG49_9ZZZZ